MIKVFAERLLLACCFALLSAQHAAADSPRAKKPAKPSQADAVFGDKFSPKDFFQPRSPGDTLPAKPEASTENKDSKPEASAAAPSAKPEERKAPAPASEAKPAEIAAKPAPLSGPGSDGSVLPPEQTPLSVLNADAPSAFRAMVTANRSGDKDTAVQYADQYVRYLQNLMFEVREYTQMIGEAMIRNGIIDEESWVGVEQYLDYEFAQARESNGSILKATEEESLKRIVPDANHEAQVYFFFTLSSGYARQMAPDVERLWQIAKSDKNLRMVTLMLSPQTKAMVNSYREYTGLTAPIFEGSDLAKTFRVAFVPTVVVVAPSSKSAYIRTGQLSFESLYRFVRTVQGRPAEITPDIQRLLAMKIGEAEKAGLKPRKPKGGGQAPAGSIINDANLLPAGNRGERSSQTVERF